MKTKVFIGAAIVVAFIALAIALKGQAPLFGAAGTEHYFEEHFYGGITVPATNYLSSTGWDYLGSTKLTATATSTSVVTIPARDYLMICVSIPSYAGSVDIGSLRFNGDTAADYSSRYISFAAGTTTATDNASTSVTLARLFAQTQSTGRSACTFIANSTTKDKFGAVTALSGTGNQATSTIIEDGGFEWATTTQITSVQLLTMNGGNLASGSGFVVLGKSF